MPFAAFSAFAMMRSGAYCSFSCGMIWLTACLPGLPTMSPSMIILVDILLPVYFWGLNFGNCVC